MNTHTITHKSFYALVLGISLIAVSGIASAHGGGGGGFHGGGGGFHGGGGGGWGHGGGGWGHGGAGWGHGGYGGWGYGGPGIVVGVPLGGYYSSQCQIVQQCDAYGNCSQTQICD